MTTQIFSAETVELMAASFPTRNDVALQMGMADSLYCNIPGIRAFWNMSRIGASLLKDAIAGQDLTNVGVTFQSPLYVTEAVFNGSTAHLYRADEATLDVLATEAHMVTPGLTVGAWVKIDTTVAFSTLLAKRDATTNLAFQLRCNNDLPYWFISDNGTTFRNMPWTYPERLTNATQWHFLVGRFKAGELSINFDGKWEKLVTAAAAVFNSTSPVSLGAYRTSGGVTGHFLKGNLSFGFLAGSYVPDYYIWMIWQWTKHLFGR